jgi:hypothetical protein
MLNDRFAPEPADRDTSDRAVLVGLEIKGDPSTWTIEDSLNELAQLAGTAGLRVVGRLWQKVVHPDRASWIGSGKVRELKELVVLEEASYAIFDDELSPGQQRKLEAALGEEVRVIDRTRLVLDIFSQHASISICCPAWWECGPACRDRRQGQAQGSWVWGDPARRSSRWTAGRPDGGSPSCAASWSSCAARGSGTARAENNPGCR